MMMDIEINKTYFEKNKTFLEIKCSLETIMTRIYTTGNSINNVEDILKKLPQKEGDKEKEIKK